MIETTSPINLHANHGKSTFKLKNPYRQPSSIKNTKHRHQELVTYQSWRNINKFKTIPVQVPLFEKKCPPRQVPLPKQCFGPPLHHQHPRTRCFETPSSSGAGDFLDIPGILMGSSIFFLARAKRCIPACVCDRDKQYPAAITRFSIGIQSTNHQPLD